MNKTCYAFNDYRNLVRSFVELLEKSRAVAPETIEQTHIFVGEGIKKVLLFSPHPDDECITGALPLRLLMDLNMRIINCAVTIGSCKDRRVGRLQELRNACSILGFELNVLGQEGLEDVNKKNREENPEIWNELVDQVAEFIRVQQAQVIVLPHSNDWNSTHIGTHYLVMDALKKIGAQFSCLIVETEYWFPMKSPNLMVSVTDEHLATLVTALSCHIGEIRRNPYHLLLPAWMLDNTRRGTELIGGQGAAAAPGFLFSTLYRISHWINNELKSPVTKGVAVDTESLSDIFSQ